MKYIRKIMLTHTYLVAEFFSLVWYIASDVRTPMVKEEVKEENCYMNCFFCWRSTSFWPICEVVSDYNDVLVALVGTRKGANHAGLCRFASIRSLEQVHAGCSCVDGWSNFCFGRWHWSLALVTVLYLYRKMMNWGRCHWQGKSSKHTSTNLHMRRTTQWSNATFTLHLART